MFFTLGDYLTGALLGVVTSLVVRATVVPGMDLVIAVLLAMALGMVVAMIVGLLLAPLFGLFETMIPAAFIGTYGGMLIGMRDSMGAGSSRLVPTVLVGAVFGVVLVLGVKVGDRALRGSVYEA